MRKAGRASGEQVARTTDQRHRPRSGILNRRRTIRQVSADCPYCRPPTAMTFDGSFLRCPSCGFEHEYESREDYEARVGARPRSDRHTPSASADAIEALDRIEALRATSEDEVRYLITWAGCKDGGNRVYKRRGDAQKKVAILQDASRHWSVRDRQYHQDRATVTIEPSVIPKAWKAADASGENGARPCTCGCGEVFVPSRRDQIFKNASHRVRAHRARNGFGA